jgi:hypothetical protein
MNGTAASYRFLAWARRGLAASPQAQDPGDGRLRLPVTLTVRKGATDTEDVTRMLRLYGPGDVVRLDDKQIIRREPRPGTSDFEPNYFPLVEFDAPDLPWLFSPEPAGLRVRPWLALVVVRRELAQLGADPRRPLPWLSLAPSDAREELPDLREAWAWAHVQLTGSSAPPGEVLAGQNPELTLSRVLCPRRLRPQQAYLACLVPVYRAGVQAGLGDPVTAGGELAWPPPGGWEALTGRLELPVYDHWEFATAEAGDFELLVRRLRPKAVGPDIGALPLDISQAGPAFEDLRLASPTVIPFEGALTSPVLPSRQWPPDVEVPFKQRLEELIELPPGVEETVLRPPAYGSFQRGSGELPGTGTGPAWLRTLNLDPAWRAVAAMGTRVVQQWQEQLMASAWEQAGELERANTLLRQAQVARAVTAATRDKHLDGLPAESILRLTEPVHGRVRVGADGTRPPPEVRRTLRASVKESVFPQAALSPQFRRALRPAGPLGRRLPGSPQQATAQLVGGLARGRLRVPVRPARGGADFDEVGERISPPGQDKPRFQHLRENVSQGGGWQKVAVADPGEGGFYIGSDPYGFARPEGTSARAMVAMAAPARPEPGEQDIGEIGRRADRLRGINERFKRATEFLLQHLPTTVEPPLTGPTLELGTVAGALVGRGGALDPDHTVAREVTSLVPPAPVDPTADPLRPRAAAPRFPQPMSGPLLSIDRELLLPGVDRIAADSIGVLVGNPRFIEAYMVGINHELSREMLWRGLPTHLAATFADRFWDTRGRMGQVPPQLPPIAGWQGDLGANANRVGANGMLVLIIRGRLLLRYPHTAVYAVRAVPKLDATGQPVRGLDGAPIPTLGSEERHAEFRGIIDPDVTYLGFNLGVDEARGGDGNLGWFFVIQEQPTAPRFGLDESVEGPPQAPHSWADLDWADVVPAGTDLESVRHVRIAGPLASPPVTLPVLSGRPQPAATWGADASQMASILYQRPMRIAIHARAALPGATS